MTMKKTLLLAALAAASTTALAQPVFGQGSGSASSERLLYGELGFTEMEFEAPGLGSSPKYDTITAIVGYKFHPNVSGEAFLGTGTSTENVTVGGVTVGSEIGNSYGLFVKPHMMLTDQVELFGRLGYVSTELEISAGGFSDSDSDSSFAYGAGANYHFTDTFYGQFAYTSFYDKDNETISGYTLGVGMKF